MRITLDSASEVSGEESHLTDRAGRASKDHSSAITTPKRKGILRNPSSSQSVQSYPHVEKYSSVESAFQDDKTAEPTPQRKTRPSPPPFDRRRQRSVTPAFELVGSPAAGPFVTASSPQPSGSMSRASKLRSAPLWMQQSMLTRTAEVDRGFESSDDEDEDSSPTSSDSDLEGSSSSTSSQLDGNDTTDSEEESWPVNRATAHSRSKLTPQRTRTRIRVIANDEDWEQWNRAAAQLAWDRARRGQSVRSSEDQNARALRLGERKAGSSGRNQAAKSFESSPRFDADIDEVRALLSALDVRRTEEDRQTQKAFEERNTALWQDIDASILAAEREAKQAAAAEARRLEAARKAQADAEQRAKAQREQELQQIEKEKQRKQEQAEQKKKAAEEEQKRAEQEQKAKAMGGSGADVRRSGEDEYRRWMKRIEQIKQDVLPLISGNPELRKQCFAAKRQITPKIGQLTNSRQEIVRITQAIGAVLASAKQASTASGEIYIWILNHLSKCLIRQAEQEVAAKQDTAYPLARVVVWLLLEGHRELGDVLMARLVKKCPWVLAVWPPREPGTDESTYRKLLGYKSVDESTENYSNRMCGIFAFYVAILQTTPMAPPSGAGLDLALVADHLRPKAMWIWCVRSLTPPAPFLGHPLAPSLWSTFLEVGGNKALNLYGRQMHKVFRLMLDQGLGQKKADFVQRESEGNVKAAMVRLELLLQAWAQNGRITEPTKGTEMEA